MKPKNIFFIWIVTLLLLSIFIFFICLNNLDKENRFNKPEKAEEIKHYEETRDQLSNVNVSSSVEGEILKLIKNLTPIIIGVGVIISILSVVSCQKLSS